jgi:hypothetical protein
MQSETESTLELKNCQQLMEYSLAASAVISSQPFPVIQKIFQLLLPFWISLQA